MLLFYIYFWILFSHDITAPGLIGDYAFVYIRQKYCMRFDYTVILKQRCYEKYHCITTKYHIDIPV